MFSYEVLNKEKIIEHCKSKGLEGRLLSKLDSDLSNILDFISSLYTMVLLHKSLDKENTGGVNSCNDDILLDAFYNVCVTPGRAVSIIYIKGYHIGLSSKSYKIPQSNTYWKAFKRGCLLSITAMYEDNTGLHLLPYHLVEDGWDYLDLFEYLLHGTLPFDYRYDFYLNGRYHGYMFGNYDRKCINQYFKESFDGRLRKIMSKELKEDSEIIDCICSNGGVPLTFKVVRTENTYRFQK